MSEPTIRKPPMTNLKKPIATPYSPLIIAQGVNHSVDNSQVLPYPLAKRLGGRDDGEGKSGKGSEGIRGHN
jgi:hypothetical protein